MTRKKPTPPDEALLGMTDEDIAKWKFRSVAFAPGHRIHAYPDVLRRLMRAIDVDPKFVSDESHLWHFATTPDDLASMREAIQDEFGVELPEEREQLYLWMIVERLAGSRPN